MLRLNQPESITLARLILHFDPYHNSDGWPQIVKRLRIGNDERIDFDTLMRIVQGMIARIKRLNREELRELVVLLIIIRNPQIIHDLR